MAIFNPANFFNKYKYHFVVWGIYLSYEIMMQQLSGLRVLGVKEFIITNSMGLALFYFHAHILLKYTLNTHEKLLKYSLPLLIVFELLFYIACRYLTERYINMRIGIPNFNLNQSVRVYIVLKIMRGIYLIGTSTVYYFLMRDRKQKTQIEKMKQQELKAILLEKEIKNELISTQNALLRAQINPHFLINTLSYLYNETRKLVPVAAESILSLSDIMQYALSKEVTSEYVRLEDEIRFVESFLLLHQAKEKNQMHLSFLYHSEVLSVPFIPLILMSLTETIVKQIQHDTSQQLAEIKITYEKSVLKITTSNFKAPEKDPISDYDADLKNISHRLSMAYVERASFNYHLNPQNYFHTCIKVQF